MAFKVNEYFKNASVSNSLLSAIADNPKWVKFRRDNPDLEDEDKKYFRVGSALDCLLTSPQNFAEEFHIVAAKRPYGYISTFVENLPTGLAPGCDLSLYQEAYDKSKYKSRLDKVVDTFWNNPDALEYYNAIRDINGRQVLAKDEYDTVMHCKKRLEENEFTLPFFVDSTPGIELLHQKDIYFKFEETECKALLDGLKIDHNNKTIQVFDLKTTGKSIHDFPISFIQFGYFRQASFYIAAVVSWVTETRPELIDYVFLPFKFIVVDSKPNSSYPAIIYECTEKDLQCGLFGGYVDKKHIPGIVELLEDYKYHCDTNQWDLPRKVYLNGGKRILNTFD